MKILGVIPVRYNSSRFPGKPLAVIGGKSMIERVVNGSFNCISVDGDTSTNDTVLAFSAGEKLDERFISF